MLLQKKMVVVDVARSCTFLTDAWNSTGDDQRKCEYRTCFNIIYQQITLFSKEDPEEVGAYHLGDVRELTSSFLDLPCEGSACRKQWVSDSLLFTRRCTSSYQRHECIRPCLKSAAQPQMQPPQPDPVTSCKSMHLNQHLPAD